MADKKMKGKLMDYCDEHSQASDSSSNPTSTEEDLEKEASETDPQSLRNRRSISPTSEEVEPEAKRPRYGSSSPDSTLSCPNFPVNQDNIPERWMSPLYEMRPADLLTEFLISHKLVLTDVIESWVRTNIRNFAPMPLRNTWSIPEVANVSRPPKPPRPHGAKLRLELGHQSGEQHELEGEQHRSAARIGRQSPPNVGGQQQEGEGPSSAQQQRMPRVAGVLRLYLDIVSRITNLEAELNHLKVNINDVRSTLKAVTDGVLLAEKDCQNRVSALENVINNLRDKICCLQTELEQIRSNPRAAEVPSSMSAGGGGDHIVTVHAGDGFSAANTDRNKANADSKIDRIISFCVSAYTIAGVLFNFYLNRELGEVVTRWLIVTNLIIGVFVAYVLLRDFFRD